MSWNKFSGFNLEKKIFKFRQGIFAVSLLSPLEKGRVLLFEQTLILFTQWCSVPSLVEISPVDLSVNFCLFWFGFFCPTREFHSHGDVIMVGEGLQTQHLWPFSSEGSLACYTHFDMGHLFMMVISEDVWHSHLLPSVW